MPPSSEPESATLTIGTLVCTISFLLKNFDFDNIAESLIVVFFFNLSNKLI